MHTKLLQEKSERYCHTVSHSHRYGFYDSHVSMTIFGSPGFIFQCLLNTNAQSSYTIFLGQPGLSEYLQWCHLNVKKYLWDLKTWTINKATGITNTAIPNELHVVQNSFSKYWLSENVLWWTLLKTLTSPCSYVNLQMELVKNETYRLWALVSYEQLLCYFYSL